MPDLTINIPANQIPRVVAAIRKFHPEFAELSDQEAVRQAGRQFYIRRVYRHELWLEREATTVTEDPDIAT